MWPFKKKKKKKEDPKFRSTVLSTVHLNTVVEFKQFCEYGFSNCMYIDYALSCAEQWKTIEPLHECYAVIVYAPNAGAGHNIRVRFYVWNPYNALTLSRYFEQSPYNFDNVKNFKEKYAPYIINWLLQKIDF